jgi:hypothetical protein
MDLQKIISMLLFGLSLKVMHHLGWFYVFSYMCMWTTIVVNANMVTHNELTLPL